MIYIGIYFVHGKGTVFLSISFRHFCWSLFKSIPKLHARCVCSPFTFTKELGIHEPTIIFSLNSRAYLRERALGGHEINDYSTEFTSHLSISGIHHATRGSRSVGSPTWQSSGEFIILYLGFYSPLITDVLALSGDGSSPLESYSSIWTNHTLYENDVEFGSRRNKIAMRFCLAGKLWESGGREVSAHMEECRVILRTWWSKRECRKSHQKDIVREIRNVTNTSFVSSDSGQGYSDTYTL